MPLSSTLAALSVALVQGAAHGDPPIIVATVTTPNGAQGDELGRSVSIRGGFMAAGRYLADINGQPNAGAARIWRLASDEPGSDGLPIADGEVTAPDGSANDEFGISVSLAADCDLGDPFDPLTWPRLAVGAWTADLPGKADAGAAYVFARNPTSGAWVFEAKLTASDAATNSQFGRSVSISGNLILVGAWQHQLSRGALYVYRRVPPAGPGDPVTWTQEAKLLATDGTNGDGLGVSVSLDGDRAIGGAWGDDIGANGNQGSAYVFKRTAPGGPEGPGTWAQEAKLVALDGASSNEAGRGVSIRGDTAVMGTWPFFIDGPGAAYVFVRTGTSWSQQAKLVHPQPAAADYFGFSVGVDGDRVIIGAWADDVDGVTNMGSVHLFERSGTVWTHAAMLVRADGAPSDYFGFSVAIDGALAVAGSRLDDVGANPNQGSVSLICLAPPLCTNCPSPPAIPGDIDGDGFVNGADLGLMLGNWGAVPACPPSIPADIDGDCIVGGADLGVLLGHWTG